MTSFELLTLCEVDGSSGSARPVASPVVMDKLSTCDVQYQGHMWLLTTREEAHVTKKLHFKCYLILSNVTRNISMWPMATTQDSTALDKGSTNLTRE